jgi:hypothetical protein
LPVLSGRRRAVVIASLAMVMVLSMAVPASTAGGDPPGLTRFMNAVAKVESGGRYTALNPVSGAYGKYQIMPASWEGWARQYLGNANAPQTAANQEKVAKAKMSSLYRWLGSWRRVAYWWLTGSDRTSGWSTSSTAYVNKVMRYYYAGSSAGGSAKAVPVKRFSDASASIHYAGRWATAGHRGYTGGRVHYSKQAGASASFTFTGNRIQWYGPVGPTRGQARISIDGRVVKVVNLHRGSFDARALVFGKSWTAVGTHTLTIEVFGTRGHPLVAIDELVVRR